MVVHQGVEVQRRRRRQKQSRRRSTGSRFSEPAQAWQLFVTHPCSTPARDPIAPTTERATLYVTVTKPAILKYIQFKFTAKRALVRTQSSSLVSNKLFTWRAARSDDTWLCPNSMQPTHQQTTQPQLIRLTPPTFVFIFLRNALPGGRVHPERSLRGGARPWRRAL